jgi:hypothetical protein
MDERLNGDTCMLCHAEGPDKRTLKLACFYEVRELVPELVDEGELYQLRICKFCRATLLSKLGLWRNAAIERRGVAKDEDGVPEEKVPGADIPYRLNGVTIMLTLDEYLSLRGTDAPAPVRLVKDK